MHEPFHAWLLAGILIGKLGAGTRNLSAFVKGMDPGTVDLQSY